MRCFLDPTLWVEKQQPRGNCSAPRRTDCSLGDEPDVQERASARSPAVNVNSTRCYLRDEKYMLLTVSKTSRGRWRECSGGLNSELRCKSTLELNSITLANRVLCAVSSSCFSHVFMWHEHHISSQFLVQWRWVTVSLLYCCSTLHRFVVFVL